MTMKVTLLGTGTVLPGRPLSDKPLRFPTCLTVETGEVHVMCDFNTACIGRVVEAGIDITRFDHWCFSHFHHDHFGISYLLEATRMAHRAIGTDPNKFAVEVLGPPGTENRTRALLSVYWPEFGPWPGNFYENKGTYPRNLRIDVFPTTHDKFMPSQGYAFKHDDKTVVFTGDVAASAESIKTLRDTLDSIGPVELLVIDGGGMSQTDAHLEPCRILDLVKSVLVQETRIIHISPWRIDEVSRQLEGYPSVRLGVDLEEIYV